MLKFDVSHLLYCILFYAYITPSPLILSPELKSVSNELKTTTVNIITPQIDLMHLFQVLNQPRLSNPSIRIPSARPKSSNAYCGGPTRVATDTCGQAMPLNCRTTVCEYWICV
jgi:hypothetical protein